MRILYIAEIVGKAGLYTVKNVLPRLKKDHRIDFVIANGDGATGGYGIGKNHSIYLRKLGVDVITGGDMTFFKKDMAEHIDRAPYILRPANLPAEMPGRGWRHYHLRPSEWAVNGGGVVDENAAESDSSDRVEGEDGAGEKSAKGETTGGAGESPEAKIAVISLLGQSGFSRIHGSNPFSYLSNVLERLQKKSVAVILDFHALTTAEKATMFHHADGKVTAVIGSGQRVQTNDAEIYPSGTAVICDAGRTGSQDSVGGLAPRAEIKQFLTRIPLRSEECWENLALQGVLIDLDLASGYVVGFEPLRVGCQAPPVEEREQRRGERDRRGGRQSGGR